MAGPTQPIARHFVAPQSYTLARLKRFVAATAFTLTLLVAVRLWFVEGLLRRVTIDGPSMAPALCGKHYVVTCGDCGFEFKCDADHVPTDRHAACPNCGFVDNSLDAARLSPPDRPLIDRWPVFWSKPRRGDVIAFQTPGDDVTVKRIAWLPGEQPWIRDGDLYVGDKLVRKTPAEFHAVRVLVYDNDFQPRKTTGLPPRWRPTGRGSRWKADAGGFRNDASETASPDVDWLEYEHWPCTADARSRGVAAPATDNDGYNQGEIHRLLNTVSDVMLSCRLRANGPGRLLLAAVDGEQRFEIEIEPRKRVILRSAGETLVDRPLAIDFSRGWIDVELGLVDQQVLLLGNGRTIIRHDYDRPLGTRAEPIHALAIGGRGIDLQVDRLRVWRDIYYLDAQGLPRSWAAASPLGADEFAVVGDNQPVSIDSRRHWVAPGVSRRFIRGHVYLPFWHRRP